MNVPPPNQGSSPNAVRLRPTTQIAFAKRLETVRQLYLGPARQRTVEELPSIAELDAQLSLYVSDEHLRLLAARGLRGEVFFSVPLLLTANPQLLGYYRLLLGFSQKEFYDSSSAPFRRFKAMEVSGRLNSSAQDGLPDLCRVLVDCAAELLQSLGTPSLELVNELQILTVGPQFRGTRNTDLGKEAVGLIFTLVKGIIPDDYINQVSESAIDLTNAAGRKVTIKFAADPDLAISEQVGTTTRNRVAIEVKGGTDASNRLNRLGEAEKSHLKAKARGFTEFWTIAAVDASIAEVRENSPTTTVFFHLSDIATIESDRYGEFSGLLASTLGIELQR